MNKLVIFILLVLIMATSVFAVKLTRELPSQVSPNSNFTVKYIIDAEGASIFGVTVTDNITGGCYWVSNSEQKTQIRGGWSDGTSSPQEVTFIAPSSGTCTFTGDYEVTTSVGQHILVDFPTATVTIEPPSYETCPISITRTVPTAVTPNSNFTIRYDVIGATGNWGVLLSDDISGNCVNAFSGEPKIRSMILSGGDYSFTQTIITAPSNGSCTFVGDFAYADAGGVCPSVFFPNVTIPIMNNNSAADISNAIITRIFNKTIVNPGEDIVITYQSSGYGQGNWGVLVEDHVVSGNCTPANYYDGWLSDQPDNSKTYTSLVPGTCTFSGTYKFAGDKIGEEKTIEGVTEISVLGCQTVADADCNGCISLTEYNDFKYGFKNGLISGVTLTEYNDIKYSFKNGLLATC